LGGNALNLVVPVLFPQRFACIAPMDGLGLAILEPGFEVVTPVRPAVGAGGRSLRDIVLINEPRWLFKKLYSRGVVEKKGRLANFDALHSRTSDG